MNKKQRDYISFLKDESFRNWVIQPNHESNLFWQQYLKANPDQENDIKKAREVLLTIKFDEYQEQEKDEKFIVFRNIITGQKSGRGIAFEKAQFNKHKNKRISAYWSSAASFLLVLGLGFYFLFQYINEPSKTLAFATIVKENPKGRKSTIILPDGTTVKLNSSSSISYPEQFDSLHRVVQLKGEAYFEVARDSTKPFSVIAGELKTTAIGTAFNVQAWQNEGHIQVALAEGKVKVQKITVTEDQEDDYYLNPGQMIIHDSNSNELKIKSFDPNLELGWKNGIIVFQQASMQEFIDKLSRWYGVEFEIKGNPMQPWSIDGQFENESLKEILESLSFTYKISYEIIGEKVIIKI